MLERIRALLTYANVTATAALVLAFAGLAGVAGKQVKGAPANSAGAPPTSGGATWYLAGSWNELPSCTSCEVSLPVSGSGSFGSTQNTGNDQLSPNATVVASDLSVHVDVAPGIRSNGSASTRTFVLYARADPLHGLRCDISGTAITCNTGAQTATFPPRSTLLVDAANSGNAPPTKVQFSWRATAQ